MRLAIPLSKALARLHRWWLTAYVLGRHPLSELDKHSAGRLSYALMMSHRLQPDRTDALFHQILERNQAVTAEQSLLIAEMATRIGNNSAALDLLKQAVERSLDIDTRTAAERLLETAVTFGDGSLQSAIRSAMRALQLAAGERVVLTSLSGAYCDMFVLWLEQVRKHIGSRVVILAMDDAAINAATPEHHVSVVDARRYFAWSASGVLHPQARGVLWLIRTLHLRELVASGHGTLVLDLDAMPVGDVWELVRMQGECDVVAQLDHSIPMDVDREFGFVLCCGFMFWQGTPAAQALLDDFSKAAQVERDDQLALNHLLARRGITPLQKHEHGSHFTSAGVRFACPDESLVSRSLHTGSVVRHFHQVGQSIVELRRSLEQAYGNRSDGVDL